MATVFDVDNLSIETEEELLNVTNLSVDQATVVMPPTNIFTDIIVAGPQGPPGLQNVYVGPDDPSATWGAAEEGFIWIQTT